MCPFRNYSQGSDGKPKARKPQILLMQYATLLILVSLSASGCGDKASDPYLQNIKLNVGGYGGFELAFAQRQKEVIFLRGEAVRIQRERWIVPDKIVEKFKVRKKDLEQAINSAQVLCGMVRNSKKELVGETPIYCDQSVMAQYAKFKKLIRPETESNQKYVDFGKDLESLSSVSDGPTKLTIAQRLLGILEADRVEYDQVPYYYTLLAALEVIHTYDAERGLYRLYQGFAQLPWSSVLALLSANLEFDLGGGSYGRSIRSLDTGLREINRAEFIIRNSIAEPNENKCDLLRYYEKRDAALGNAFAYLVAYEVATDRRGMADGLIKRSRSIMDDHLQGQAHSDSSCTLPRQGDTAKGELPAVS